MAELSPALEMMRLVAGGGSCEKTDAHYPMFLAFQASKQDDEKQFRKEWLAEEKKLGGETAANWDGEGSCPACGRAAEGVDEGSERAMAAARALLEGL